MSFAVPSYSFVLISLFSPMDCRTVVARSFLPVAEKTSLVVAVCLYSLDVEPKIIEEICVFYMFVFTEQVNSEGGGRGQLSFTVTLLPPSC